MTTAKRTTTEAPCQFYLKQLEPLVDGKIVGFCRDERGEFFGLRISTKKGETNLWFLRDDEGNGPGSFEISNHK